MEEISQLFETPKMSFADHLNKEDNTRILFSGNYGIGKTTFLNHFFNSDKSEYSEKYNAFHLFPVNYSVLQNEDIFSYLKYDIFYEIFIKYKEFSFKENHFSFLEAGYYFGSSNIDKILATFLLLIPKLGKQLFQFQGEIKKLKDAFQLFKKLAESKENEEVKEFISSFHEIEGELYEDNSITLLIREALNELKGNSKKNILIIDDLDRIDPNHIFRLFNVFAAQFDHRYSDISNKFGFDKIIFVCDIKNIREIFRSQYGSEVDFSGYIDKFYSKEVYYFDNKENVIGIIDRIVEEIKIEAEHSGLLAQIEARDRDRRFRKWTKIIFKDIVSAGFINLRALLKFGTIKINLSWEKIQNVAITNIFYDILVLIDVLKQYFGENDDVIKILEKCKMTGTSWDYEYIINDTLLFAELEKHQFKVFTDNTQQTHETHIIKTENREIEYNISSSYFRNYRDKSYWISSGNTKELNLYPLLIQAMLNIDKYNLDKKISKNKY